MGDDALRKLKLEAHLLATNLRLIKTSRKIKIKSDFELRAQL